MNENTKQNDDANLSEDLELINELSELSIREEYLSAALHGPRWILGLISEVV